MTIYQQYLTIPQLTALRKLSKKLGLTVSELIRRAVDQFLAGQK